MIYIKNESEIAKMRQAGRIIAKTMREVSEAMEAGKHSLLNLDSMAEKIILAEGGIPSFKGYKGFPATACIAVNDGVVHGIPTDYIIQNGDIVTLDFGVIWQGWHADSAWTFAVGEISPNAQRLMNVTKESLYQGIGKAKVGNKIGDISFAVQNYVERNGYSIVRDLVGHGIGQSLHEEPSVPNFGKARKGVPLRAGMTFCIEPMVNEGTYRVKTLNDGWTVVTADGKLSAHYEHTVVVTSDGPLILTSEED